MDALSEIVRIVSSIAGQTSLSALNATIGAARAGEAERGSLVVAAEGKKPAGDASQATLQAVELPQRDRGADPAA